MKVVAINGSPKRNGNTALALDAISEVLEAEGIRAERMDVGGERLHGCSGCGACRQKANRKCRLDDDGLNDRLETLFAADGIILGSPVYYAGINGALKSFLDRAFFVAGANGSLFRHKAGASLVAVRRAGAATALDQLNKYLSICEMFIATGNYWSMVYGRAPGEAAGDAEGMQCARVLGANLAWLLKAVEAGRKNVPPPPSRTK